MLRPVERQRAVAFHVQVTRLAVGDRVAPVVEDLQLVSGHRFAARAGAHIMRTVGAVDVQHLGRADAVEDRQAERLLPPAPDLGRQCFGRGHAVTDAGKVAALRAFEVEDRVVEGWRAEEQGRPLLLDGVEHGGRGVAACMQDCGGAHPVWEREVVAEPVGMEETGGRESRVPLGDAEHLLGVGDASERDVVLQVHHGLRLARRA